MKRNVYVKPQFISFEVYKNIQNAKIDCRTIGASRRMRSVYEDIYLC